MRKYAVWLVLVLMLSTSLASTAWADAHGSIYVPVYSHVYHGVKARDFQLAVTLSVRNMDTHGTLVITSVDYYDTSGNLVKAYQATPLDLGPMSTKEYIVPERDKSGGSGANFIVRWTTKDAINPPLVQAVMIGTQSAQGISFVTRGVDVKEQK